MPIPAPNTVEVFEKLNKLWYSARRYVDPNDIQLRIVERLAKNLLKSHAAAGWTILAALAGMKGDEKAAREDADRACRLSGEKAIYSTKAGTLGNLGYFSEAGEIYRQLLTVDWLSVERDAWEKAIANGAILALDDVLSKVGNIPTAVPDEAKITVERAALILRRNNVSDQDISHSLDKVGVILRENRLFFMGYPELYVTDEEDFSQVWIRFTIDVGPADAAKLNLQLVDLLSQDRVALLPDCCVISFSSAPDFNERKAA